MDRFATSLVSFATGTYAALYGLTELILFAFKGVYFVERTWVFLLELLLLMLLIGTEFCLLSVRTMRSHLVLELYLVSTVMVSYFIFWQQHVLFVEIILGAIYLAIKVLMLCALLLERCLLAK